MSILIALETSENERVVERALDLHHMLHNKHSTLVNVRFLEHTRGSYEYQRTLTAEVVGGCRALLANGHTGLTVGHRDGTALLQGWYSLLSEKRAWRNDFLKQICRIFDYDISRSPTPVDVGLALYICDNVTSLEYKLQEEVMTVVSALVGCVSGATDLVMVLESSEVDGDADDEIKGKHVEAAKVGQGVGSVWTVW
jgi:cohesin loading factor subunit SCC2